MRDCEHFEILVSTWLDGQLDRPGQIECLDHLVRCEACRGFYVDARALDGLVAAVRAPRASEEPVSPEVWKRIEWAARSGRGRPVGRRVPAWALQAAAVLVVGLGVTLAVWNGGFAPRPAAEDIALGEGTDMTEARFVELTREVLGADPRFRAAMQRVLEQVARDTATAVEASSEEPSPWPEGREATEAAEVEASRIPA